MKKSIFLSFLLLTLTSCAGNEEEALVNGGAAESSLRVVTERTVGGTEEGPTPAAIAGILAGNLLGKPSEGYGIPPPLENGEGLGDTAEDTNLLRALLTLLDTDLQQLLNTANNREDALDTYVESLETHTQRAEIRLRTLQDDQEQDEDDSSRFERRIREIRGEMEDSINEGNTQRVSLLTDELIQKQRLLSEASAHLMIEEHFVEAYEDVLEPIKNRLRAINVNRDALLKGVTVTDIPGVEDLKLIEYEDGRIRVRGGSRLFF